MRPTFLAASILALAVFAVGACGRSRDTSDVAGPAAPATGAPSTAGGGTITGPTDIAGHGDAVGPPAQAPSAAPVPAPSVTQPATGTRARRASWTLAGTADAGRTLLLDVAVGAPGCDVVTGTDVHESAATVLVTVYAGVQTGAYCGSGVPAIAGTERIAVTLAAPLGTRRVSAASTA